MDVRKLALAGLFIVALVIFFAFDLGQYLTLSWFQEQQQQLQNFQQENWLAVFVAYFVIYVVATALSLPGAVMLTLGAGALFGLGWGLLLASFASTLGATLAFLSARFILRDWVHSKFSKRLTAINKGMERDGAFYLLSLRLVPLFPFFVINLAMGLTSIKARTFYWVSQVGMVLGTAVYINAGTQLSQLDSLGGIFSFELVLSFALLGIFPLIAKFIVGYLRRRKVYEGYNKPKQFDYNLVVIGAGSAGLVSAYIAAAVKAKVLLVEKHKMGGDCLNTGCVPSKALLHAGKVAQQQRTAHRIGITSNQPQIDFAKVMQRVQSVIQSIEPHDSVERYTKLGVEVAIASAEIISPWRVKVTDENGEREVTAKNIIVAAGAGPFVPDLPGLSDSGYLTAENLWQLRELPKRLVVMGGGPIGCELAQAFSRLGSEVTIVEQSERLLIKEDSDVASLVQQRFEAENITLLTNHKAVAVGSEGTRKYLEVERNGKREQVEFDQLLVAVGRKANLTGYGLENIGVKTDRTIVTNELLQTNFPNIYAAGDVAGPYQFTHTASHQAWYAAVNALFSPFKTFKADYRVIPWATFTDPEVATVGLTEATATEQGIEYEVTRYDIGELDRALTEDQAFGMVKVLTVPGKDKILGATIVGAQAGELIAEFVLAMKHTIGLNKILGTIHIYPTMAEANKYLAGNWKRANAPEKLLQWVERFHHWRRN
ncbi:MAG: dihydrolipoyl dehydrogenase [Idiomarina sp.]